MLLSNLSFGFVCSLSVLTQPCLLWSLENKHQHFNLTGQRPRRTWSKITNQSFYAELWYRSVYSGFNTWIAVVPGCYIQIKLRCKGIRYLLTDRQMAEQLCWCVLCFHVRNCYLCLYIIYLYLLLSPDIHWLELPVHSWYLGLIHEKQPLWTSTARKGAPGSTSQPRCDWCDGWM